MRPGHTLTDSSGEVEAKASGQLSAYHLTDYIEMAILMNLTARVPAAAGGLCSALPSHRALLPRV